MATRKKAGRDPVYRPVRGHEHPHVHPHEHPHVHPHVHPQPGQPPSASSLAGEKGKLLYLDAGSGVAGDMLVAALLDLGVPRAIVDEGLSSLDLRGYTVRVRNVRRGSIAAKHFDVHVSKRQPSRDYTAIVKLIERATGLSPGARSIALDAFARLARAEARVHGTTPAHVHFHEVGAVDSIVDIVACAVAFDHLGARVRCSPLPMGRGFTRSAHGMVALPAPATVLCLHDVPTYDAGCDGEFVTPTGACLVASVASDFGGWPAFRPERVGVGAGSRELADRANVLRVILGTQSETPVAQRGFGTHVVVEANVDDMSAEVAAYALARAFDAGACDAWSVPIGMKKSRAGLTLCALASQAKLADVARALLIETTSFGVRYHAVERIERPRRIETVSTRYGELAIKIASGDGLPDTVAPEYEACASAAQAHAVPIREVYAAALAAYASAHGSPAPSPR